MPSQPHLLASSLLQGFLHVGARGCLALDLQLQKRPSSSPTLALAHLRGPHRGHPWRAWSCSSPGDGRKGSGSGAGERWCGYVLGCIVRGLVHASPHPSNGRSIAWPETQVQQQSSSHRAPRPSHLPGTVRHAFMHSPMLCCRHKFSPSTKLALRTTSSVMPEASWPQCEEGTTRCRTNSTRRRVAGDCGQHLLGCCHASLLIGQCLAGTRAHSEL